MKYIAEVSFKIEVEAEDHVQAQNFIKSKVFADCGHLYEPDTFNIISIREEKE